MDGGGDPKAMMGMLAGFYGFICCFGLVFYIYFALSLMKIAQKLGVENAWLSWIPIVNLWIMVQCAGKEWWWILLPFIPLVGFIFGIMLWMAIAERRGKPSWIGILIIVPVVGFIVPGYLAFTD
jgi:signal peptidase I